MGDNVENGVAANSPPTTSNAPDYIEYIFCWFFFIISQLGAGKGGRNDGARNMRVLFGLGVLLGLLQLNNALSLDSGKFQSIIRMH